MMAPKITLIEDDDDITVPLNPDVVVEVAPDDAPNLEGEQTCPICGKGPFKRINAHMTKAHGEGSAATHGPGRKAKKSLEEDLGTLLAALSMAVAFVDQHDGFIIAQNGPPVARAWSNLALQNPKVDKVLRSMMGGVSYGEVIMATAGMLLPILAHHKLLPAPMSAMFNPPDIHADSSDS